MKKTSFYLITFLLLAGCHEQESKTRSFNPQTIFSHSDAQQILGDRTSSTRGNTGISPQGLASCRMDYVAMSKDSITGHQAKLTFRYNELASVTEAKNFYASAVKTNVNAPGMKIIKGVGDEAYFQSDDSTYYYLFARKNNKTFDITVNRFNATTSLDDLYRIAAKVSDSL